MTATNTNPASAIRVTPSESALGAEISGINVAQPLPADTVAAIRAALIEHCVVYFRRQTLSEQAQVDFTANFGRPEVHVRDNPDEITPGIFVVSNVLENGKPIGALGNDKIGFHSDLAYMPKPGTITMLYALIPRADAKRFLSRRSLPKLSLVLARVTAQPC